MGAVDFLLDLADVNRSREIVQMHALKIVDEATRRISAGIETEVLELQFPGLFHGLAGIAYCGARVIRPELPSLSGQLSKIHVRRYLH
jgi:lantibiotic modifying enzyme